MSGSEFSVVSSGATVRVTFRASYEATQSLNVIRKGRSVEKLRRQTTCNGASIASDDSDLVRTNYNIYCAGGLKGRKTVSFQLTDNCQNIVDDFRSKHPYIESEELAYRILFEIGVKHGGQHLQ